MWSELARCLLTALACWKLTVKDPFFTVLLCEVFKSFDLSEIVTFIHFYSDYEKDIGCQGWNTLPDYVQQFMKTFVK